MKLNTDHLRRCIRTLESSLTMLSQAAPDSIDYEVFLDDARSIEAVLREKFGDGAT